MVDQLVDLTEEKDDEVNIASVSTSTAEDPVNCFCIRGIAHLDISPVYLGDLAAYGNLTGQITTVALRRRILREFYDMPPDQVSF